MWHDQSSLTLSLHLLQLNFLISRLEKQKIKNPFLALSNSRKKKFKVTAVAMLIPYKTIKQKSKLSSIKHLMTSSLAKRFRKKMIKVILHMHCPIKLCHLIKLKKLSLIRLKEKQ
jgi:hypothetical protein